MLFSGVQQIESAICIYITTLFQTLFPYRSFRSDQSLSRVQLFATPWIAARQASLSITNSRSSLRLTSIESVMSSSHLILCHPLLILPPIPPSIRVFSNESTLLMRWPKYWSLSFSISPSKGHQTLISFRMDQLDLLAVQGTLKSLLQHHSLKASILQCSALFIVQLSHPYMINELPGQRTEIPHEAQVVQKKGGKERRWGRVLHSYSGQGMTQQDDESSYLLKYF